MNWFFSFWVRSIAVTCLFATFAGRAEAREVVLWGSQWRASGNTAEIQQANDDPTVTQIRFTALSAERAWLTAPLQIIARSNLRLFFDANARLEALPGVYWTGEAILNVRHERDTWRRSSDISIIGASPTAKGQIGFHPTMPEPGYRDQWDGNQWKHGRRHVIQITNSDRVLIQNIRVQNSFSDGIYIGEEDDAPEELGRSTNVTVVDTDVDRASRNGITIAAGTNISVVRTKITRVRSFQPGVAVDGPGAGIDVEPNWTHVPLRNIFLGWVTVQDVAGPGVLLELARAVSAIDGRLVEVWIAAPTIDTADVGIFVSSATDKAGGELLVTGGSIRNTRRAGILARNKALEGPRLWIDATLLENTNLQSFGGLENRAPIVIYKQNVLDRNGNLVLDYDNGNVLLTDVRVANPRRTFILSVVGTPAHPTRAVSRSIDRLSGSALIEAQYAFPTVTVY